MSKAIQGKYVLGKYSVVGDSRRKWEDRVFADEIQREGWDPLVVGVVADGVGSADFGSRGAQLAIDTVVHLLELSQGNDIPHLLETTMEAANRAVYQENQEYEGDGLTTLVVAIVSHDRVYVGNVGDSRAYWVQSDGKLLALTRDHNYHNIYGGDINKEEAGVLVNAVGKKESIQVDLGFYLMGDDRDQAYKLGMAGLPLKPGDAILLCSDGLIKCAPQSENRYARDDEIVNALKTEGMPDRAAIKMVSTAEGRRPDDNVSAVTIQGLADKKNTWQIPRFTLTLPAVSKDQLIWVGVGLAIFLVLTSMFLGAIRRFSQKTTVATPQPFEINMPATVANTVPSIYPSLPPSLAIAHVESVIGAGGTVNTSDDIMSGQQVSAFLDGGVKLTIPASNVHESSGVLYIFGDSSAIINVNEKLMPTLARGAIYIQPSGTEGGEVHFGVTENIFATISGSRMILEIKGNEIWLHCFEGICEYHVGSEIILVPPNYKMAYLWSAEYLDPSSLALMSYDEKWDWNRYCSMCMSQIISTPTPDSQNPTNEVLPQRRTPIPRKTPKP